MFKNVGLKNDFSSFLESLFHSWNEAALEKIEIGDEIVPVFFDLVIIEVNQKGVYLHSYFSSELIGFLQTLLRDIHGIHLKPVLSQKDCISSFARRDIECFSAGKEVEIFFQKRVGFSPKSKFLRSESLVPPFLVSFQKASVVRAYPSILQQFKGNLNVKKFLFGVPHSLRFTHPPNQLKSDRRSWLAKGSRKKDLPRPSEEENEKKGKWFNEQIA